MNSHYRDTLVLAKTLSPNGEGAMVSKVASVNSRAEKSHVTAKRWEARGLHTASPFRLTPREVECLEWLGRGLRVDGIGSTLGIGVPTVATHLSGARKKLGA